jgi:ectoine hydroxylase-related dioxygenase (phytanoyl-CoA dioxygenase family)
MSDIAADIAQQGFCLVPKLADDGLIDGVIAALERCETAHSRRGGQTYGARNLLQLEQVRTAASAPNLAPHLKSLLGRSFLAVRGLFFDKTDKANWPVPWHQDLTLAVRERRDMPGWRNWTEKRGIAHVQPPPEILERMVTVRIHLDDCPTDNGPLRLIPQSHRFGVLGRDGITAQAQKPSSTIPAKRGDVLFMRPLILHASSPALTPRHRRVLHLEFAPMGLLPGELRWAEA